MKRASLLFIILCIATLGACGGQQKPESKTDAAGQTVTKAAANMIKDPVCGMDVDSTSTTTVKTAHEGKSYYFCSVFDKKQFEGNPSKFVAAIKQ